MMSCDGCQGDRKTRWDITVITLLSTLKKTAIFQVWSSIVSRQFNGFCFDFRLGIIKPPQDEDSADDADKDSLSASRAEKQNSFAACFRLHPRRWRHQCPFMKKANGNKTAGGNGNNGSTNKTGRSRNSSFRTKMSTAGLEDRDR